MWKALEAIYKTKSHQIASSVLQALSLTFTQNKDDLIAHLANFKNLWNYLNQFDFEQFKVSDMQFKGIIPSSPTLRRFPSSLY